MSGDGKGSAVHKETAKWLLTFVPIPTFLALALGLGNRFTAITEVGVVDWVRQFPVPALAIAATAIATAVIIAACCRLLLTGPIDWRDLKDSPDLWSKAFSEAGVGEPYFKSVDRFSDFEQKRIRGTATDAEMKALADTQQRIVAWTEDVGTRERFNRFLWTFGICAGVILLGLGCAMATLPTTPEAITKPSKVAILVSPDAQPRLAAAFAAAGCTGRDTTVVAVGGLWNNPELRLVGDGCQSGRWTVPADLNAVVLPAGSG